MTSRDHSLHHPRYPLTFMNALIATAVPFIAACITGTKSAAEPLKSPRVAVQAERDLDASNKRREAQRMGSLKVSRDVSRPSEIPTRGESGELSTDEAPNTSSLTPLSLSLGYISHRADTSSNSYINGDGALLRARVLRLRGVKPTTDVTWGVNLSYLTARDERVITPSAADLMVNEPTQGVSGALNRPPEVSSSLGWRHRATFGVSARWDATDQRWMVRAEVGARVHWSARAPEITEWACLVSRVAWIWLSVAHRGDGCEGPSASSERALIGAKLGRAQLGVGWGVARWDELKQGALSDGGPLGWARVPISAPLYFELSAWSPQRLRIVGAEGLDRARAGRFFSVALTWTGERYAPERAAPRAPVSPGVPPSSSPGTPRPTSPRSPNSPLSPFPTSPTSPMTPGSPASTPL